MRMNWAPVAVLAGGLLLAAVGSASADHRDRDWHDRYQYSGSYRTYPADWNRRYDRDDRWDRSDRRDRERWRAEEARRHRREIEQLERERRERERAHWRYERRHDRDHDRYDFRRDRPYRD